MRACLDGCFRYRRQTLYNNLRKTLAGGGEAARQLLDTVGLDGQVRAETLEPASFLSLSRHWPGPSR
jgi:16S rRNA A1518/A1519 N6-dimethyltransferase RsmA/KsgA/DIM1 with predicted DNA glycosylase/AP lyase activity